MITAVSIHGKVLTMQVRGARGFTLIEVLVVVVILAILAAIVVPRVIGRTDDAMLAKARSDVQGFTTALNLYKLDNFTYPSTDQGLDALMQLWLFVVAPMVGAGLAGWAFRVRLLTADEG